MDRLLELMILRMAVAMRLRRGSAVANLALSLAEESAAPKAIVPKVKRRISVRMQPQTVVCVLALNPPHWRSSAQSGPLRGLREFRRQSENKTRLLRSNPDACRYESVVETLRYAKAAVSTG